MNERDVTCGELLCLTEDDKMFLNLANNPVSRPSLLALLQELGLLSEFLAAESGTNQ
jgi:hypothetical protein